VRESVVLFLFVERIALTAVLTCLLCLIVLKNTRASARCTRESAPHCRCEQVFTVPTCSLLFIIVIRHLLSPELNPVAKKTTQLTQLSVSRTLSERLTVNHNFRTP